MRAEDTRRFYLDKDIDGDVVIKDRENDLVTIVSLRDALYQKLQKNTSTSIGGG